MSTPEPYPGPPGSAPPLRHVKCIAAVLSACPESPDAQCAAWFQHLRKGLKIPFDAKMRTHAAGFVAGERVHVLRMGHRTEPPGVVALVRKDGAESLVSLHALFAIDRRSQAADWLDAYAHWYNQAVDTGENILGFALSEQQALSASGNKHLPSKGVGESPVTRLPPPPDPYEVALAAVERLRLVALSANGEPAPASTPADAWADARAAIENIRAVEVARNDERIAGAEREQERLRTEGAAVADKLRGELDALGRRVAAMETDNARLERERERAQKEIDDAERRAATAERKAQSVDGLVDDARRDRDFYVGEYRKLLARFEALQAARTEGEAATAALPGSYGEVAAWVEENLSDRLTLLPRARRALEDAQFGNLELVCRALLLLANEYRQMRRGALDREEFERRLDELRLRWSPSVSPSQAGKEGDEYYVSYPPGTENRRQLEMHLRNRAGTRNPARCLAIYFFWDTDLERAVVGWLPGHLRLRPAT